VGIPIDYLAFLESHPKPGILLRQNENMSLDYPMNTYRHDTQEIRQYLAESCLAMQEFSKSKNAFIFPDEKFAGYTYQGKQISTYCSSPRLHLDRGEGKSRL